MTSEWNRALLTASRLLNIESDRHPDSEELVRAVDIVGALVDPDGFDHQDAQ